MKIITAKNFIVSIIAISFFNLAIANASEVISNNQKNIAIAVVDIEDVLKNSEAMKDAQKKIGAKQAKFQKEIDETQKKLENESKILDSKKTTLKEDAFKKEQDKFSKKIEDLRTLVDSRQGSLKTLSVDVIEKINDKIKEVVDEIKEAKKLDIIISSSSTIFYDPKLDISDEILKRLNKTLPKVKIN